MSATDEHTMLMDLAPQGRDSQVFLDGTDISSLLVGVVVSSHVQAATMVQLFPAAGRRAQLLARLPEAAICIMTTVAEDDISDAIAKVLTRHYINESDLHRDLFAAIRALLR